MNAPLKTKPKHFLDLSDHDSATLTAILADAKKRKLGRGGVSKGLPDADQPLNGKVLAMIFDKQSTRTRIPVRSSWWPSTVYRWYSAASAKPEGDASPGFAMGPGGSPTRR